jgi:ADP-L-glycero-D-manno-heptose 6-epimerase
MIIVTGGAGFIGSALIWQLNQAGMTDIIAVDRFGSGDKWKNLVGRSIYSLMHKDALLEWLDSGRAPAVEAIFHMGACSTTTEVDMDFLLHNNFDYSKRLFEYCSKHQIPFIYASSAATYGRGENGFSDDPDLMAALRPINKYGYSKQLFDIWAAKQKTSMPWVGLKFFNVYGPQEYHKGSQASVVYHAFPQVRDRKQLRLFKSYLPEYDDGKQKRDFIYVKDVVDVMMHVYQKGKNIKSGIYNLGTGTARTFMDLGKSVFDALEITESYEFIEMPDNLKSQYQYFTEASMDRMRRNLQYDRPFTSLEDGIFDYVRTYLAAKDSYL